MEPPLRRLRNEQFMPGGGAPPSIRELAEQSYAMRESDLRENSHRKQRDDTLYRRSMDPDITHTRKNTPDAGTMPKYTKEGIIKRNQTTEQEEHPRKPPPPPPPQNATPPPQIKKPTMLHRFSPTSSSLWTCILIIGAIVGVAVLCTCNWSSSSPTPNPPSSQVVSKV